MLNGTSSYGHYNARKHWLVRRKRLQEEQNNMPPIRNSPNETVAAVPLLDIPHGSAQKAKFCCTRIQRTLLIVFYCIVTGFPPSLEKLAVSRN